LENASDEEKLTETQVNESVASVEEESSAEEEVELPTQSKQTSEKSSEKSTKSVKRKRSPSSDSNKKFSQKKKKDRTRTRITTHEIQCPVDMIIPEKEILEIGISKHNGYWIKVNFFFC
jgi:hypothetical protein